MLAADNGGPTIARDTVYSAVMLVLTGLIGLCLVLGGHKHFEQKIRVSGTSSYLAVLGTLATIALILPNYTVSTAGPTYSTAQLTAVAIVSLMLYGAFLFIQTVRHRDYFLAAADDSDAASEEFDPPSRRQAITSLVLPGHLAHRRHPAGQDAGARSSMTSSTPRACRMSSPASSSPPSCWRRRASRRSGPRSPTARRPAINLALGSALASIALTIPVITLIAAFTDVQLALGVPPAKVALLVLAMFVSVITLLPGRTTVLHGVVHLGIFVMFIVVAAVP